MSSEPGLGNGEKLEKRSGAGVGIVLALLISLTGLAIAGIVHGLWTYTANRNVRDVATQLNSQIVTTLQQDLAGLLSGAEAAREAARSIFFQGTIDSRDEAKREFIFLSLLQSNPNFSWIAIGWPNGDFFGAHKASEHEIRMVEVGANQQDPHARQTRVDSYRVVPGDVEFKMRHFEPTDYLSGTQPWYRRSSESDEPLWSEVAVFPTRVRPSIATSVRLDVYQEFVGVISVAIELERLSRFLANLTVGKSGAAYILAEDGRVVATSQSKSDKDNAEMIMPDWQRIDDGSDPMLDVAARARRQANLLLGGIGDRQEVEYTSDDGKLYFVTFAPLAFQGWTAATVIPADDFLGSIAENTKRLLWALALFVLLAAIGATLMTNVVIVNPIRRITQQLGYVEKFMLDRIELIPSPLREFNQLSSVLVQMGQGLASFQKFLPTEIVRILVAQGVQAEPGGARRTLTIFFSDLVGFTHLSEALGNDIVPVLAEYLGQMSNVIQQNNGTVDKFIGDAVMAFWNAPLLEEEHAIKACVSALVCQKMLAQMRLAAAEAGRPQLHMRIGLNTGEVTVGNIGSNQRLNYTAIGDPVNVASRLEALNKVYGTNIMLGAQTRLIAGDRIIVRRLDWVAVYGRAEGTEVYELLGLTEDRAALGSLDWVARYEAGLDAYRMRQWSKAIAAFQETISLRGEDHPSQLMIDRCRRYESNPPEADWSGVDIQSKK